MTSVPITPPRTFTVAELRRVGTAATMIAVCGTLIILGMMVMMGHYNSLAHCGPKAALDGAVIALLIGRRGRWRCLTLLGVVYGLVLLLQIGLFYLLPVMALAGLLAAAVGRTVGVVHRTFALALAAATYELLAGCGAPIRIYFGTGGHSEPFVWGLWIAEWPLRIVGAWIGVWMTNRWQEKRRRDAESQVGTITNPSRIESAESPLVTRAFSPSVDVSPAIDDRFVISASPARAESPCHNDDARNSHRLRCDRASGVVQAGIRMLACIIACTLPMMIESATALAIIAIAFVLYATWAGLRPFKMATAMLGLFSGWIVFGLLSYAWHRDTDRVMDLSRTLVLRFTPIAMASASLVKTVRPVDLVRLLRRLHVGATVLIPTSAVIRSVPHSQRASRESIAMLRAQGHWSGLSFIRNPGRIVRGLIGPQVQRWVNALVDEPDGATPR